MANPSPFRPKTGHTLKKISDWVFRCDPNRDRWKNRVDHHDAVAIACAALHDLGYRYPTPIPLTERLPGPGDCDAEGRCWVGYAAFVDETDYGSIDYNPSWELCKVTPADEVWLPHDALPTPGEPATMRVTDPASLSQPQMTNQNNPRELIRRLVEIQDLYLRLNPDYVQYENDPGRLIELLMQVRQEAKEFLAIPETVTGPSDVDLWTIGKEIGGNPSVDPLWLLKFARAVLARWGHVKLVTDELEDTND